MTAQSYDLFRFYFFLGALFINFSGYVMALAYLRSKRPRPLNNSLTLLDESKLPAISFIVPVYQEAEFIQAKLENIVDLVYPSAKLKVLVVAADSSDDTLPLVRKFKDSNPGLNLRILLSSQRGKIHQLNEALRRIDASEIVIVSDADAILPSRDSLVRTVGYLRNNTDAGVVGAWTVPQGKRTLGAEKAFWDKENRMRYLETLSGSSSIVIAPFYAFYRNLIDFFPEDCVADDVHLSFLAHDQNRRIIYAPDIEARECRQPETFGGLFRHKLRKAHAYTTELLRQLHRLPHMATRVKFVFLFKVFQFFYLPWASLFFFLETVTLILRGHLPLVLVSYGMLLLSILITSFLMRPAPNRTRGGTSIRAVIPTLQTFCLINTVLIANFFLYIFWAQGSIYPKANQMATKDKRDTQYA